MVKIPIGKKVQIDFWNNKTGTGMVRFQSDHLEIVKGSSDFNFLKGESALVIESFENFIKIVPDDKFSRLLYGSNMKKIDLSELSSIIKDILDESKIDGGEIMQTLAQQMKEEIKQKGWNVSCEITPHHLFLTSKKAAEIGSWAKSDPPIRSEEHVEAAWKALDDGTIDMVATDHSPYSHEEKDVSTQEKGIFGVGSGTPGLETMIPLLLDAVNKKKVTLKRLVEVTSSNPALRFGLYPRKGSISLNSDADLIFVDMNKEYSIKNEDLYTKQKISIFEGWKLRGKIERTMIRGKVIFENGDFLVEKGNGFFITPNSLET